MKIGILTYHRARNYGAMLQAYALREFLSFHGYKTEFIDYWPLQHEKDYRLIRPLNGSVVHKIIKLVSEILTLRRRAKRIRKFENFREHFLQLPKKMRYSEFECQIHESYDCAIVGSDQIWRNRDSAGNFIGWDKTYFCQTIKSEKCISYAASMGVICLNAQEKQQFATYIKSFDTILVRERSLKELVETCGQKAELVLDPTLLFYKTFWNKILPTKKFRKRRYILYYELSHDNKILKLAKNKAKEMECDLKILVGNIHDIPHKEQIQYASPIDFIHAIRDAEFVICDSFHGTVFSLIFEKQFATTGLKKNNDRVDTLLAMLDLSQHHINSVISVSKIDYTLVNKKLDTLRYNSQRLLLSAIEN